MSDIIQRPVEDNQNWAIASSKGGNLLPKHFQNNPGSLFIAAELADSLGIPRVSVLSDIYVVDGKPTLSANLMASQVRRAGHKLRIHKKNGAVKAELIRKDDPDFAFESIWTIERAQKAGLASKNVWKQYPEAMMRSRAISEVVREGASEVLSGVNYAPEDFDARAEDAKPATATTDQKITVEDLIQVPTEDEPVTPPEPTEPTVPTEDEPEPHFAFDAATGEVQEAQS